MKISSCFPTIRDYKEESLLKDIYKIDKIQKKIDGKKVTKVINVQNKIINIIIT